MDRRRFLATTTIFGLTGCLETIAETETYENSVFEPTMADPSIIRYSADDGDVFYVYGTEDHWYHESDRHDTHGRQLIPIAKSRDLVEWEYVGEVFDTKPDWKEGGGLWAPDIAEYNDQFYLYYAYSEWGDENPAIGVATADHPAGPFDARGKLFDSEEIGVENSIDPFFMLEDGTPYLFWGSWYGIWGVELSDDGLEVAGEPFRIAADDHFEAPWIIERDGYYYFFGSNGSCCDGGRSTYHVVVGRSESFDGPYVNRNGDSIENYPGTTILEGGEAFLGPGHNAVIRDDDGDDWLVYHAYHADDVWINDTPRRALLIDRIRWEDGWPTIEDGVPSEEAGAPVVER
ncbi:MULTISPECIES: family 43 glycosylhydrolase [Natrialbaceae]|uniref:family 43 glycosylhydrolase n=1 Tax=Natrialbaceae TaxID=1644061 RepID=UPI00207C2516|nr:family 43 glycosylhydrolase [Natronococcus sp. CG52]